MKRLLFQLGYTACVVSLGAALAVVLWAPAFSQGVKSDRLDIQAPLPSPPPVKCGPLDKLEETLMKKYKETRGNVGLSNEGSLLGIYSSPTGSWTAVIIAPNGIGCVVAAGEHWTAIEKEIPGMDS